MAAEELRVAAEECAALAHEEQTLTAFFARETSLGELKIIRALPIREKRLVGPWCFLDRYGPHSFTDAKPMDVAPHPHCGLQTVTWLLEGEVLHDDSIGSQSVLKPGGVNIMTAGNAIAHAEQTPKQNSGKINGVQLWTALPDAVRNRRASFQHVDDVPRLELKGGIAQVFAGQLEIANSGGEYFSPIFGSELTVHVSSELELPLTPSFEHAVLLLQGDATLEGQPLDAHSLFYLGTKRYSACFRSRAGAKILLIGGEPFKETILMWWNFVARTPEEIAEARKQWQAHERFGEVKAYAGPRLDAPPLIKLARPNPAS